MRVLICISALFICHKALSFPSPIDVSNLNDNDLEKLAIIKNNNYFQGSEQIFNIYNITLTRPRENATCNEKNQTVQIPDGYTLTPGIGAHKLIVSTKTWNEARKHCIAEGAHLAMVTSAKENALIKNLLATQKIEEISLGFHELFQKDDWVTTSDQPLMSLPYVNWRQGEPNNLGNAEHCGSYFVNGLNDERCTRPLPFICKIIV